MRPMAAALRWHLQSAHTMFQSYFHRATMVVDNFVLNLLCTNRNGMLMRHFDDYFHIDDEHCDDDEDDDEEDEVEEVAVVVLEPKDDGVFR